MSDKPANTVLSKIVGIATICIGAIVAYPGWPASGWLAVGLIVSVLLIGCAVILAENDHPILSDFVATICHSTLYVNAGVALVCVIQTLYYIGPFQVSPVDLPVVEERISDFYAQYQEYANLKLLSIVAIVVIALNVVLHNEVINVLYMRSIRLLSMISFILLGATSFTTAGIVSLDRLDENWRKSATDRIVFNLKDIAKTKRQLVALAWVEDRFWHLDLREQDSLREFFRQLVAHPPHDIPLDDMIGQRRLLQHFSSALADKAKLGAMVSDLERQPLQAQQSLKSLRELNAIRSDKVRALSATRTAAIELVVNSVITSIPGLSATIASDFVSQLMGGLASKALHKVRFDSVDNFADAKAWIREASGLRFGQEQARLQWELDFNRFQDESSDRTFIKQVEQSLRVEEKFARERPGAPKLPGPPKGRGRGKSDRDLKHRIRFLGRTPNGLKIYSFRYHWSDTDLVGVMAQDLLADKTCAEAVTRETDGYYAVDYASLGLHMTTLEAWQNSGLAALVRAPLNESRLRACSQD